MMTMSDAALVWPNADTKWCLDGYTVQEGRMG